MKRLIYSKLLAWKQAPKHKPLIVLGARQVGKTYILKEFGVSEFESMVYVNCHRDSFATQLFRDLDTTRIVKELERYFDIVIVPGKTLLVFDEIQEVANGIASLKYFCEDLPDLHVAVAGSLLGISIRENESYPVGKVQTIHMYPMSFIEFLMARGKRGMVETLSELDWSMMNAQHEMFIEMLREYFFVGGMPEAVADYCQNQNTSTVRQIQSEILDAYQRDMSKHTKSMVQRIRMVWDSIPAQLARENKKFVFGAVRKGGRAADFELALQWLSEAGIVAPVCRAKSVSLPLKFYSDNSAFKIYMLDCGLLACMAGATPGDMLLGTNAFVEFKGAFTENYVLQQIRSTLGHNGIFYFAKDNSTQEVDFLLQTDSRVLPIEVKATVNVKSKSLSTFINNDHADQNLKGLRCSLLPYTDQGWMENIPLYAAESYFSQYAVGE